MWLIFFYQADDDGQIDFTEFVGVYPRAKYTSEQIRQMTDDMQEKSDKEGYWGRSYRYSTVPLMD